MCDSRAEGTFIGVKVKEAEPKAVSDLAGVDEETAEAADAPTIGKLIPEAGCSPNLKPVVANCLLSGATGIASEGSLSTAFLVSEGVLNPMLNTAVLGSVLLKTNPLTSPVLEAAVFVFPNPEVVATGGFVVAVVKQPPKLLPNPPPFKPRAVLFPFPNLNPEVLLTEVVAVTAGFRAR